MEEYIKKLKEALNLIECRYHNKLNKIYDYENYKIKPMFANKYTLAYTAMLDDEALGLTPVINASVYNSQGKLFNKDFSKEEFLSLYRAVKDLYKPIEHKYQQYLAEFSQNPSEERLKEIIENDIF